MRVCWLQAVDFESLGTMEPWLRERGHAIEQVALWRGDRLPTVDDFDVLIATGGAFVPTNARSYPWIGKQLDLLRSSVALEKRVLGICLGAQLLAHALGSPIRTNDHREIGWHPVDLTRDGMRHPLMRGVPAEFEAFHWHQDTVAVPPGAVHLASSAATVTQAFAVGARVLGVQFHPEIEARKARIFAERSSAPRGGLFVQGRQEILCAADSFRRQQGLMETLLANLLAVAPSPHHRRQPSLS